MRDRDLLLPSILVVALALAACDSARADGDTARGTASYTLTVKDPTPVKAGNPAAATVQVVPKGPYKINLEFPLKLKVSGPASATPRELQLTGKQAAKLTKAELVLRPSFKVGAAGSHPFKGTLRFSVCTDAQCEIKSEAVSWTAVVR